MGRVKKGEKIAVWIVIVLAIIIGFMIIAGGAL